MSESRRRVIPAVVTGALGAILAACPPAFADEAPTAQELKEQIRLLQAKVEQLEARQQQQQLQQQRADKEAVDTAVGAAEEHARRNNPLSLSPQGFTAGYNNGKFIIQSEDGAFLMNPNAQMQFRYVANHRDNGQPDGDSDWQTGFELRRLKLNLDGNVFGKENVYKLQWASSRSSGNLVLEEAWLRAGLGKTFGEGFNDWAVKVGQFKDPVYHEEITSSKRQLAVERSLVNFYIGGNNTKYEQGVTLVYDPKNSPLGVPMRAEVGFIDGANTSNTNFTDTGGPAVTGVTNASWGALGRVEFKFSGDWKSYDDFTAMKTSEDLVVVGGGFNWTEGDGGVDVFHTVDLQWEPTAVKGLGVYAAYLGLFQDRVGGTDDSLYHWGFLVQAGYLLDEKWEIFGRYDYTGLDDGGTGAANTIVGAAGVEDSIHEITIGVNHYFHGHASKVTADFTWLPNGSPISNDGAGVLNSGDEDQFLLRLQYQLLL